MKTSLSFRLPWRHVRASLGRMILSIVAVALGVALVVAVVLMNQSVLRAFLDTIDGAAGRAQLSAVAGEGAPFSEKLVETVQGVAGVRLAVPLVTGIAFPDDRSGELLNVYGVDLGNDTAVRTYHDAQNAGEIVGDLLEFLSRPDSIIIGREFAARRGIEIGGTLNLVTPAGVRPFTVRGLLDAQGLARTLGGRLVVMDLYAAERAFTADGQINQIDLLINDGTDVSTVKSAMLAALPSGFRVEEPELRKDVIQRTVRGFQAMLTAFGLLAVLAGFVICYSRLGALFEARTWEVGLLRAIGLRRSVVFAEMLKESLFLGVAGTALGIPLGILIGRAALPFAATSTALNFHMPVPSAAPTVTVTALALGVAIGIGAALLAALMPALRLARTQPVAALTMRGRDVPRPPGTSRLYPRLFLLVCIAALVLAQGALRMPALGHATTALVVLAVALFSDLLVRHGAGVLGRLFYRLFGPAGDLAATHLRQRGRRTTLTVGTLGLGLSFVLMFGILGWSFERTLVAQVASRLRADLVITSAFVSGGWMNSPLTGTLLDDLRTVPQVVAAAGEQRRDITVRGQPAVLDGYDSVCFKDQRVCTWPLESGAAPDAVATVARGEGAIVSTAFAYQLGVALGDSVEFDSPNGPAALRVVGVTRAEPTAAVIFNRDLYRQFWNDDLVTWVHVALAPGTPRADAEAAIAQRVGERYRLQIRSGQELIDFFASQARAAFSLQYVMEAITFLLVVIGVGDTLASSVADRAREFGMLRATGLRRTRLCEIVMLEGMAIGILGLVLAVIAGLALGAFWTEVQFPAILGWQLDLHFPFAFIVSAGVLAVVLCLTASVAPSLRAARMPVPAALRNE